ncbi:MAG: hypothetical protein ACPGUD_08875 [Parashewanella sp.]
MLTKFLIELGQSAELLEAYKEAPKDVIQQFNLNEDQTKAVLSGDAEQLAKLNGDSYIEGYLMVMIGNDITASRAC